MATELLAETNANMQKAIDALRRELATIRTGRARPALVENIRVTSYGVPTPLMQVASITAPEPRMLIIQPYDRQLLPGIEKAILRSELGLTPTNDGRVIRLVIPQLTEERRRELVRVVHKKMEEGRVAVRNIRRDTLETLRAMQRDKQISEDEEKHLAEQLQRLTDGIVVQVEQIGRDKEAELMEV